MQRWTFKQARSECSCLGYLRPTYTSTKHGHLRYFPHLSKSRDFQNSHIVTMRRILRCAKDPEGPRRKPSKRQPGRTGGDNFLPCMDPFGVTSSFATQAIKILKPTKAEVPFSVNETACLSTGRDQEYSTDALEATSFLQLGQSEEVKPLAVFLLNSWPCSLFGPWGSDPCLQ